MRLPIGYYAVQNDFENASKCSFTYKGISYEVTEGENLFPTLAAANKMATETPSETISGLEGFIFDTPVIIFSDGRHTVDGFAFNHSVTLLGQNAGVTPNLFAPEDEIPEINPIREENESILYGSFWAGAYQVGNPAVEKITVDGFSVKGARFNDLRWGGGRYEITFRNMIHQKYCGYTLYTFAPTKVGHSVERYVTFENIRVVDFDDCDYGANFVNICATKAIFDGIVHARTNQSFGLCDATRRWSNFSGGDSEYVIKNSLFAEGSGYGGLVTALGEDSAARLSLVFDNTKFINASEENFAPISPEVSTGSSISFKNCTFKDTRGSSSCAVKVLGDESCATIENTVFEGFAGGVEKKIVPTVAEARIIDSDDDFESSTADSHVIIGKKNRDMSALDALYEGRQIYRGDLHMHTKCGGTSDGAQLMSEWPTRMDELGVDFVVIVDHKQMRGFFLPEWDEERFVMGTEPSGIIAELNAPRNGMVELHYNMLFPHKYGLAMVLANFPEFQFKGDELTGSFKYFKASRERYFELFDYVRSIGGMVVHAHPKTMLVSSDPLDYYFGEHSFIETIYDTVYTAATRNNYKLWQDILALGKHVYASGGSDSHGGTKNTALAAFYTEKRHSSLFFDRMKKGDFNVGSMGIKMCIGEHPMGDETSFEDGMILSIRVCDYFDRDRQDNTVYSLRVFTDEGLAFESDFDGSEAQSLQLKVKKRKFYRADIYDKTHECVVGISNPIWLDK